MPDSVRRATRRPGRPGPDDPALTRDAILTSALALVDEEGFAALTMRRLAARLHVDPMSIYHHVPNKAALVSGLVQKVSSEMAEPVADGTWRERVRAWARAYRDLALAHPHLVLQFVTDAVTASEAAILISEPLYAALSAAGLRPRAVVEAAGTLVDFVHGYALGMAGANQSPAGADPLGERLAGMDPDRVPALRRVLAALPDEPATRDAFEAGLDLITRGAAAR
jgi:AcrR family transcriptional regulator